MADELHALNMACQSSATLANAVRTRKLAPSQSKRQHLDSHLLLNTATGKHTVFGRVYSGMGVRYTLARMHTRSLFATTTVAVNSAAGASVYSI